MDQLMPRIDMIACFFFSGEIQPIKFRYTQKDGISIVVKIDKIISREENKWGGNRMLIFKCRAVVDGIVKNIDIRYEVMTQKWFLHKVG